MINFLFSCFSITHSKVVHKRKKRKTKLRIKVEKNISQPSTGKTIYFIL